MSSDTVSRQSRPEPASRSAVLAIVLVYAIFASCWILLSDKLVQMLFSEPSQIILVSIFKDWVFVVVTSLLLYGLIRSRIGCGAEPKDLPLGALRWSWPFIVLGAAIVVFTCVGILSHLSYHKKTEITRLETIADLKSGQIVDWLREKQDDANFVRTSDYFAEQYRRWQESGDLNSGEQFQTQLEQFRKTRGFSAVTLLSPQGKRLWDSTNAPPVVPPNLQAAADLAAAAHKAMHLDPYRDAIGDMHLDFIAPLLSMPSPVPLIILHTNLTARLFPILQTWIASGTSSETLLFRRDGNRLLFLNEPKLRNDANDKRPVATEKLLTSRLLRSGASLGNMVEGVDYRGIPVIGVVRAVAGTDWFLVVKLDLFEFYAEAAEEAAWFGLVGLLVLFITGAVFYLVQQGQQLGIAQAVQQSQAERMHALQLLAAIADSSNDAIFAKDREGRYILFNRAAGRFIDKPVEEVVGRDDRHIFPPEQAERLMIVDRQVIAENSIHTQEEALSTATGERVFLTTKGPLRDAEGKVIGIFGISLDITERKKAEAALQASELSYRSLFDNMINGYAHCLMLFDNGKPLDFIYLDVNKAFETQTGLRDVVGRKVSEVIPGLRKADPILFEIYGRVAMGSGAERFEVYVKALQNWYSVSVYSPQTEHFVAVFEVITERKQAELALSNSERRFRTLFDLSPIPLSIFNQAGTVIAVNMRFVSTFGYAFSDLPTLERWWSLAYPDPDYRRTVMDSWNTDVQRAMKQGVDIPPRERRVTCKDGKVRTMVISGIMIGTDFLATFFDVTERRAAEDALRARERYQRAVLDNFPFMVWLKDTNSRILAANKAYARVANVADPDELIGKTDLDYWEPELAEQYRAEDRAVLESGRTKMVEDEITEAGQSFWIESYKSPVELDGRIIGTVGFARDITERREADAELHRRNDELDRFNRAMVGRELDIIALKQQINALSGELGREPPYPLAFLDKSGQEGKPE